MGATGLSNTYFFNNHISGKLSVSLSATDLKVTIDTVSPTDHSTFLDAKNKSTETNVISNYTVTAKITASHLIKTGITYQATFFNSHAFSYFPAYGKYIHTFDVNQSNAGLLQSFIHWQYRPTELLTINSGVHYQNFLLNHTWAIEPRLGARYQLSPKQNLNFGYGMHSQTQPTIYYFYDTYIPSTDKYYNSNRNLDLSKSQHFILSYDYNFAKNYRFKCEAYYQYLYNIPIQQNMSSSFSMINAGNSLDGIQLVDSLVNKGTGQNHGIEFTIEKFFSNHFYFLVTTSLYQSTYKGSDNIVYHTSYDGNYVFNSLGGYELTLGKNKTQTLSLDLKYTQAGGNRYTPIDLAASQLAGEAVYISNEAFSKRFKDYTRFDFKLSYKINKKKTAQSLFISIENVFNRQNILRQSYNPDTKAVQIDYQFGRFPYGGWKIEF
jgi:hypothetical protein